MFKTDDSLDPVSNEPKAYSGIYLIYASVNGSRYLIYIGISGSRDKEGNIKHRNDGLGGRFLKGKTDSLLRKFAWPNRMIAQNIAALEIDWYVTYGEHDQDFPRELEIEFFRRSKATGGRLPLWNKCI